VNFLGAEAKNWPETSVPNADACWLMRIITADSACMKNYYFSGLIYEMVNCLVGVILK
jgi:hypothetical protein